MTKNHGNDRYRIGYGKPPEHTRFRPGVSGNPTGKREGARNLSTAVKKALLVPVKLKDGGEARKVSTQEAVLMRLREKALKGDARSLDRMIDLARQFNNDPHANSTSHSSPEDEETILDDLVARHGGPEAFTPATLAIARKYAALLASDSIVAGDARTLIEFERMLPKAKAKLAENDPETAARLARLSDLELQILRGLLMRMDGDTFGSPADSTSVTDEGGGQFPLN
jgi:hypothetical protein